MSVRLRRVAARSAKRLFAILLILSFLVGSAGIPVVSRVAKDRSQPFPCMDNPCGCTSADECWHHCCCHTNREKVAWAHEHSVTPPDFVLAAAEKEEQSESSAHVCAHHHGCEKCAAKAACEKCAAKAAAAHAEHAATTQSASPEKKTSVRFRLVLVDMSRHCKSLPEFWSLFGLALPVQIETGWSFDAKVTGRVVETPVLPLRVELSPPVPPPKLDPADC